MVEAKDVVLVMGVREGGQPGQLLGGVGTLETGSSLVVKDVDVGADGELIDCSGAATRRFLARLVLVGVGPPCGDDVLELGPRWLNAESASSTSAIAPP